MMVEKLYIVRHGETLENVEKILQGHMGGTLSDRGARQADQLGYMLRNEGIDSILAGDLDRQMDTAKLANRHLQVPVQFTSLLRERGGGSLEGKYYSELGVVTEEDFDCYDCDGQGVFAPIEPIESVVGRANQAVEIIHTVPGVRILVVGSGWINSYIANIIRGEPLIYHDQDNCGVHYFRFANGKLVHCELNKEDF